MQDDCHDGIWNDKFRVGPPIKQSFVMSSAERSKRRDDRKREELISRIVILDMETDPFNNELGTWVWPFVTCIYAQDFCHYVWKDEDKTDEDYRLKILEVLENIEGKRVIYAHNGGKFDYMFLLGPEMRGRQIWKGRSLADSLLFGRHRLRDSMHIMPNALRTYKKEDFDYEMLLKKHRQDFRQQIEFYVKSDCQNAYPIVTRFLRENGFKMTIGQASIARLKVHYSVSRLSEHMDGKIRGIDTNYYHKDTYGRANGKGYYGGGRVETIAGRGIFKAIGNEHAYTLYDINSMYPYVMAYYQHPVGCNLDIRLRGNPNNNTAFIHLRCRNHGALVSHAPGFQGIIGLTADVPYGEFYTTIHEYKAALELGLIEDMEILECIDVDRWSDFSLFVLPLYEERQTIKHYLYDLRLRGHGPGDAEYDDIFLRDLFLKFYLNNAYGKFGQNPRNHDEVWLTRTGEDAPFETVKSEHYRTFALHYKRKDVWEDGQDGKLGSYRLRAPKDQLRFYNIATAASITGAARAKLLQSIWNSSDPIYCDTDSLICHSLGYDTEIDEAKLGAWKIEKKLREIIIAGKKLYCYIDIEGNFKVKSKGVGGLQYQQMKEVEQGLKVKLKQKGVTINKDGSQYYMERTVSATAQYGPSLLRQYYNLKRLS